MACLTDISPPKTLVYMNYMFKVYMFKVYKMSRTNLLVYVSKANMSPLAAVLKRHHGEGGSQPVKGAHVRA